MADQFVITSNSVSSRAFGHETPLLSFSIRRNRRMEIVLVWRDTELQTEQGQRVAKGSPEVLVVINRRQYLLLKKALPESAESLQEEVVRDLPLEWSEILAYLGLD